MVWKHTWAKAYINLQNISLSMVKKRLPNDIGNLIGQYFPNRKIQFSIIVGPAVWMSLKYTDNTDNLEDFLKPYIERMNNFD